MSISFEGIGEVTATFLLEEDGTVKPGDVVCLSGNDTVGLGTAGTIPCGVAATVAEDGCIGVQIGGLAEVAYSGETAPAAGWNTLAADGQGGVSTVKTGGRAYLAVSVDTGAQTALIML